jgi:DNA (cytosine-5)-methyltransferase 1
VITIGSACTGYGGLDAGVVGALAELGIGAEVAWHADTMPASVTVLAHHYPGTPNLGDLRRVQWWRVVRPDMVVIGYPCQGESVAGRKLGTDDPRDLQTEFLRMMRELRPTFVVVENVDRHHRHGWLRVAGELVESGYDVVSIVVSAAQVGAAHLRKRMFALAVNRRRLPGRNAPAWTALAPLGRFTMPLGDLTPGGLLPTPVATDAKGARNLTVGRPHQTGMTLTDAVRLLPTPKARDGEPRGQGVNGYNRRRVKGTGADLTDVAVEFDIGPVRLLPTVKAGDSGVGARSAAGRAMQKRGLSLSDVTAGLAGGNLLPTPRATDGTNGGPNQRGQRGDLTVPSVAVRLDSTWTMLDGVDYGPAVRRWEAVSGLSVPAPSELGPRGGRRLAPAFASWLMGVPDGWVTDPTIGLTRNEQLTLLGNGVVPHQATLAVMHLGEHLDLARLIRELKS